jgi:hypothetical protein
MKYSVARIVIRVETCYQEEIFEKCHREFTRKFTGISFLLKISGIEHDTFLQKKHYTTSELVSKHPVVVSTIGCTKVIPAQKHQVSSFTIQMHSGARSAQIARIPFYS